jgi:hypothetical protein
MTKQDKVYEVVHTIRMGKGDDRNRGDEVKASELEPGEIESFLKQGILRDPEAPVTGATTDLAHDRLLSIAQKLGLVTVKGSEYRLGDKKAKGVTAFREKVSLNDLEEAIVAAATAPRRSEPEPEKKEPSGE